MTATVPDVTFIIAAYNAERFLADAIESSLAQRDIVAEVVVADDRSTDGTVDVARRYERENVSVVALPQNGGPSAARNAAIARARGRWLAVLDSDDILRPDRTTRMIALAESSGAEVVVDNVEVATADGAVRAMFDPVDLKRLGHIDLPAFILSNRVFRSTHNFGYMKPMLRRDFVTARGLRYDESLRIGEDYVFLASALAMGARCVVDPDAGYVYRVRGDSISAVLELAHVRSLQRADAAFERSHVLDDDARRAMNKRKWNLAEAAAYLELVDHIKDRAVVPALSTAIACPSALRLLRMPIGVRLRRLATLFPILRSV